MLKMCYMLTKMALINIFTIKKINILYTVLYLGSSFANVLEAIILFWEYISLLLLYSTEYSHMCVILRNGKKGLFEGWNM